MGFLDVLRSLVTPSPSRFVSAMNETTPPRDAPSTEDYDPREQIVVLFRITYENKPVRYREVKLVRGSIHDVTAELLAYEDVIEVSAYERVAQVEKEQLSPTEIFAGPAIVEFATLR